ncbi:MAG TPA: hypothetical protein VFA01_09455 [Candidatus Dormibacteraeota bacterium]|nr:hypothetical protein [Candidatus Dormibacteraeota bacterium]
MNALVTLPLVLFVVLFELAIGGTIAMVALERTTDTPLGFLRLAAVVDLAAAAFAALIAPSLSPEAAIAARLSYLVAALMAVTLVMTFAPWTAARRAVEAATAIAGVVLLVAAASVRFQAQLSQYDVLALVALPVGALALGGVDGAMLLGHWYLVTPKLSPRPLQTAALIFVGALLLQAVLLVLAYSRGFVATAWEANAAATVLRIFVGIVAPLPIAVAAWWTARLNTQSSTGLLYIALGMVLAGEIMARMLFYVAGVPI